MGKPSKELFDSVDRNGRCSLIWDYGEFIVSRDYYGCKFALYAMPRYLAEVVYNPVTNKIKDVRSFNLDSDEVKKYLPFIDIRLIKPE